jgi:tRNA pseudouridine65 synthase
MDFECLYEDDELFVLNKPSGVPVHRGWAQAEVALVDYARSRTVGGAAHPLQRLDRSASGSVLFAKNARAAHALAQLSLQGLWRKDYVALVRGGTPQSMDIDHPISRREDGPRVEARTLIERVGVAQTEPRHVSLVFATPLTGRLHQIRRHLKHVNHPLIGDVRYGRGDLNRAFRERFHLHRLALHAYRWAFWRNGAVSATTGIVPLPTDMSEPLRRMGFTLDHEGFLCDFPLPPLERAE